jgi:hypothetical protein
MRRLRELCQLLNPDLLAALQRSGADELVFTYRWFLVDFKRECEPVEVSFGGGCVFPIQLTLSEYRHYKCGSVCGQLVFALPSTCPSSWHTLDSTAKRGSAALLTGACSHGRC